MWRLAKALVGKCVYVFKKLSFSGIRGQINELWTKGTQKTCGVISKDTKVGTLNYWLELLFRAIIDKKHVILKSFLEIVLPLQLQFSVTRPALQTHFYRVRLNCT